MVPEMRSIPKRLADLVVQGRPQWSTRGRGNLSEYVRRIGMWMWMLRALFRRDKYQLFAWVLMLAAHVCLPILLQEKWAGS